MTENKENYWKEKYADIHIRLTNRIAELEQENKELKSFNKKICEDWEKEIKVYWNALEEIRILATKNVSIENFVKIQTKINKVLNS